MTQLNLFPGQWLARPFRKFDKTRYVIFAPGDGGKMLPVGGAVTMPNNRVVAFIGSADALKGEYKTLYRAITDHTTLIVMGNTLREALAKVKQDYPDPFAALEREFSAKGAYDRWMR
jgi:hypothetical protein